jgi:hypothetical protein
MIQEATGKKQIKKTQNLEENPINSTMNLRKSVSTKEIKLLNPNNFVCTTAVKVRSYADYHYICHLHVFILISITKIRPETDFVTHCLCNSF